MPDLPASPDPRDRAVTPARIPALTGLRAVAALWVLLVHFGEGVFGHAPNPVRGLFSSGFLGVDLFFILSGFILSWNYLGPDQKLVVSRSEFWGARAARVLPVYYVSLCLALPLFLLWEFQNGVTHAGIVSTIVTAITTLTLTQSWVSPYSYLWNNPGWSLSVEIFFYLGFPYLASWLARQPLPKMLRLVGLIYAATIASAYLFVVIHAQPSTWKWEPVPDYSIWISWLGCNPLVHLHEFLLGMAAYLVLREERTGNRSEWMGGSRATWIALVSLLLVLGWKRLVPFMPALMGIHAPLFTLLIYGLAKQRGPIAQILSSRVFVFLGEISYSLYLTHLVVWWNVENFNREHPYIRQDSVLNFVLCTILALTVATLLYKGIEEPYRRVLKARFAKLQGRPVSPLSHHPDPARLPSNA